MSDIKYQVIAEAYAIVKEKGTLTDNDKHFIQECVTNPYGITLEELLKRKKTEEKRVRIHEIKNKQVELSREKNELENWHDAGFIYPERLIKRMYEIDEEIKELRDEELDLFSQESNLIQLTPGHIISVQDY